jgi:uncharacterized membrane protein SirB2
MISQNHDFITVTQQDQLTASCEWQTDKICEPYILYSVDLGSISMEHKHTNLQQYKRNKISVLVLRMSENYIS